MCQAKPTMKRILITGVNGYIGTHLASMLETSIDCYQVETIDLRKENWHTIDFSGFDTLVHAAGIAHRRETKKNRDLYYKINRDLSYTIAKKAKDEGVSQFIYLSSMSVYGMESGIINHKTCEKPTTHYGKSKLQAEQLLVELADDHFAVAILRPPMIYGKDCKGNYQKLVMLALITPIFPDIDNKRSMIYIGNLCAFITKIIKLGVGGLYFPQNREYVNTTELVKQIAAFYGKPIIITKSLNRLFSKAMKRIKLLEKMFGTLIYEMELTEGLFRQHKIDWFDLETITFKESVRRS